MKIISFHNGNIPTDLLEHQAQVFQKFKLDHHQVLTDLQHFEAIDNWLATHPGEDVIFMDVDCIPLQADSIARCIHIAEERQAILGAIQNANHIPASPDYASPAFVIIIRSLYDKAGQPSFHPTSRADCGGELTYACKAAGINVILLPVSSVQVPKWSLANGQKFGHGTTYIHGIYHAFESRFSGSARKLFVEKCRAVLSHS